MSHKKVLVPLATGFEEIEAVSIIDVLRRGEIEVIIAHIGETKFVKGAHGIAIETDCDINTLSVDDIDMIVLPGGWDGTLALINNAKVTEILQDMDKKNKAIGAICAAPLALHKAGVLKHNYTCYPSIEAEIRLDGYNDTAMVVEDDNVMTSKGPVTAMCFGLSIVKKLAGEEKYKTVKAGLLADYCL
ncbi:MAG: DJ-1/PfpI family protein [Sulfurimonadaceae bacterium]|jgi:4-methyl-5(b-hydroxyethyl)-thiazole monophosphate biosynthesis|nr:DJ-1/PfpI family protein [Sulfurimonadaceae bacterium]